MNPSLREQLEVALSASRPLPASNAEECRELLTEARKVSVADHAAFRESISTPPEVDEIDLLAADGEMILNRRSRRDANRVLDILDELEMEEPE